MSLLLNLFRCLCLCVVVEKGSWYINEKKTTNGRRKIDRAVLKKDFLDKKKKDTQKPDWLKEWTISKGWVHNKSHLLELGDKFTENMENKNYERLSESTSVSTDHIDDLLSLNSVNSNVEIHECRCQEGDINITEEDEYIIDNTLRIANIPTTSSYQNMKQVYRHVSENYRKNFPDAYRKYSENEFSLPAIYKEQLLLKEKENANLVHHLWNYVKAKRKKKLSVEGKFTENELYDKNQPPENLDKNLEPRSSRKTHLGENIAMFNTLNDRTNLHEDPIYECSEENSYNSINNVYLNPVYASVPAQKEVQSANHVTLYDRRMMQYHDHLRVSHENGFSSKSKTDKYVIRHIRVRIMLSLRIGRVQKVKNKDKRGPSSIKNKISNSNNRKAVEDDVHLRVARMHDEQRRIGNGRTSIKIQNMRYGRLNVLRWLLWEAESREDMPALEKTNNTTLALHYAAARGCLDCVRLLVDSSPELSANTQMDNDVTPVYLAAQEGHLDVLKFLVLEAGGSLYVRAKDGMAPIHAASQMGCLNCVKWMIQEQGVDPNLRDGDGATPLHFAASRGHLETVRWLLKHGARLSLDKYGKSPINDAAENQQVECLNVLVQHGTTPDYQVTAERPVNGTNCSCSRRGDKVKRGNSIGSDCSTCKPKPTTNVSSNNNHNLEPFYLHPPLTERTLEPPHAPENGLYINPMSKHRHSASSSSDSGSSSGSINGEAFYLHNPQEVIYNRVKDLFESTGGQQPPLSALTVKVEVHSSSSGAGSDENLSSSDLSERSADHENDYEDIYLVREESNNKLDQNNNNNNNNHRSQSRDSGSHSRSGSVSSSNSGVVVNLSTDNLDKSELIPNESTLYKLHAHSEHEPEKTKLAARHSSPPKSSNHNNSRLLKRATSVPVEISPPPPPPPLPDKSGQNFDDEDEPRGAEIVEIVEEPTLKPSEIVKGMCRSMSAISRRLNSSCSDLTIVSLEEEPADKHNGPNLVNKQRVLPFVPPSFPGSGDSNNLIKPSEYLRSITDKRPSVSSRRSNSESEDPVYKLESKKQSAAPGPPPPPLPDFAPDPANLKTEQSAELKKKQNQPLSAISIQDLNSVQLRRTDKMLASKTFSAPTRSMSLQCLQSEPFLAQKTDLIAELKMSRDITGIKKMKVEKAKTEESREKELFTEISKQFTTTKFVERVPEKDNTGNIIPAWKRQMLAKKAAEKAKKELEEKLLKEAEEKRMQAIPQWKRQLIIKKEEAEHKMRSTLYTPKVVEEFKVNKLHENETNQREGKEDINNNDESIKFDQFNEDEQSEEEQPNIIPWRAQLRKTNSKLNLLD